MSLYANWRVVPSLIISLVIIASFFHTSFLGAVAAAVAGVATICVLWCRLVWLAALGPATVLISVFGVVGAQDNTIPRKAADIFDLSLRIHSDPVTYDLSVADQNLAKEVIAACGFNNYQRGWKLVEDSAYAIYEPYWTSWLSWAFKSSNEPSRCFTEANRLAARSPAYKQELDAILK